MEECLKRKLVFGDRDQIEALKRIKKRYEEIEKILCRKIDGDLKKYKAIISYTRRETIEVDAPDKEAAELIADFESNDDCTDFDDKEIYVCRYEKA